MPHAKYPPVSTHDLVHLLSEMSRILKRDTFFWAASGHQKYRWACLIDEKSEDFEIFPVTVGKTSGPLIYQRNESGVVKIHNYTSSWRPQFRYFR